MAEGKLLLRALSFHPTFILLYQASQIRCLGLLPPNAMQAVDVAFRGNLKEVQVLIPYLEKKSVPASP